MEIKKKLILILIVGFLLVLNILSISAESCIEELSIEVATYETQHLEDDSKLYVRSSYQPTGNDKFVRRSDILFIESVYAKAKPLCHKVESVILQFKRPNSDKWGEDLSIHLDFTNSSVYSFELMDIPEFDSIIYKTPNGNKIKFPPPTKTLSNEGVWEFREIGVEEEKVNVINDGWRLPGEIFVMDRIAVTQLKSLRQIQGESKTNTIIVILIGIFTILLEGAAIYVMWRVGNKQIKKTDEHYKKQTRKEDQREKGKQLDLLETLFTELNFLENNLNSYKDTFSKKSHYPFYELWDIDAALYLRALNHKIKGKETIGLKENLMILKDKLLIINNMKLEAKKEEEERGKEKLIQIKIESLRKGIIEIIDADLLPILRKSKKFIKKLKFFSHCS